MNTREHERTLKDYQAEAISLINIAMSGKQGYAKERIVQVLAAIWDRRPKRKNLSQKVTKVTKGAGK